MADGEAEGVKGAVDEAAGVEAMALRAEARIGRVGPAIVDESKCHTNLFINRLTQTECRW